jgi:hypothetical protein
VGCVDGGGTRLDGGDVGVGDAVNATAHVNRVGGDYAAVAGEHAGEGASLDLAQYRVFEQDVGVATRLRCAVVGGVEGAVGRLNYCQHCK